MNLMLQSDSRQGWPVDLLAATLSAGCFPLVANGRSAPIVMDPADWTGVLRAAADLQADIERVTGVKPELQTRSESISTTAVIAGTIGRSSLIDNLVKSGKIQVARIAGQWESFLIAVVDHPVSGVDQALVIAGSDKRGTIYGLYEISMQIGVSPWYWWADVPTKHRDELFIRAEMYVQGPPAVKYRGIFINDEEPCFGPWAREKFGGVNSKMYAHLFELLLRLRGNFLWPAMWGKAFNEDDPLNPKVADEYGIVMGTSHHEPMIRAQEEWGRRRNDYGSGAWNYATNEAGLKKFWAEGIARNKDFESIVTVGMRGDGDEPMIEGGDPAASVKLLEKIVADQRHILERETGRPASETPQLWALYKEVADYYSDGMRVPDDVTLLWCDDNWGNIRRLPTDEERKRSGGAGIYYHFDYVGAPRCYKWINTSPLPKIWEEMSRAHAYGANKIWVVNVGDIKPMEIPIEFFLRLAWDPEALPKEKIADFTRRWADREFGPNHAPEIADIVSKYAKYNGWRKPELLDPATFSQVNYEEAERAKAAWNEIADQAGTIYVELPPECRDAFFQLVLYPTQASATVAEIFIRTGRNRLYARQGRASANIEAERVRALFRRDQELTDAYHALGGGRWNHLVSQTHIGYTNWFDPKENVMPEVSEVEVAPKAVMGVAVEGSESAWPGEPQPATLPPFDELNDQRRWLDVFNRGSKSFAFSVASDKPWVSFSPFSGMVGPDQRIWVEIEWSAVPSGVQTAVVTVAQEGGEHVSIGIHAVRSDRFRRGQVQAFGGLTGPIAIDAESASRNVAVGGVRWERIPDYGHGASGMSIFPIMTPSILPPADAPRLEYPVLIPETGRVQVDVITGPTLNVQPGRGVRIAVSFDDQLPVVIDAFEGQIFSPAPSYAPGIRDWPKWVMDNARTVTSTHEIGTAGVHTLKVWMVDPGVVLEKLVIHRGDLPKSYFGPPSQRPLS